MTTKTNLATPAYNSTNWDTPLNSNFTIINDALGSTESVSITTVDVTLTATQAQKMRIALSGALTGNRTLFFPSGTTGSWVITNGTTGAYAVTVSNVAGSATVSVSQGTAAVVISDGTNFYLGNDMGTNPPGTIIMFAGASAPYGYLWCDGTAVSRTVYSRLFTAIGTAWGSGDGSSTFNLPNSQGAFFRGSGDGLNTSTRAVGSYEADAYLNHSHTITDPGHTHSYVGSTFTNGAYSSGSRADTQSTRTTSSATTGITGTNASTTGSTETRPKNYACLFCIKY